MKTRRTFRLLLGAVLVMVLAIPFVVLAAPAVVPLQGEATCPDGDGWTKIDSDDLSLYPVDGAADYCFKAGSSNSQGCTGGIFDSWPQPEGTCGLSHWSYFIPEEDPTETPPTPTEVTPTETPPTPTEVTPTPTDGTPTVTETPPTPGVTPTPTREREDPPETPKTGGGWELFLFGGGALLTGISTLVIRRRRS